VQLCTNGGDTSAPAAYARGAQLAAVKGDPTKEGMYVVRLKVPAGFKIAPHTHPNDENVTVLSGTFNIGTGDKPDESKGTQDKAGGYSFAIKGMPTTPVLPKRLSSSCMGWLRKASPT